MMLSTAVSTISGVETLMSKRKKVIKSYGNRVVKRTAKRTARSVAAIPLEAVPYVGIATIITVTGLEIKSACDNVKDMNQLYRDFDIRDMDSSSMMDKICNPEIPSVDSLMSKISSSFDISTWNKERITKALLKQSDIKN